MEDSILTSTKKILGIAEAYEHFDVDIITHINSAFSVLTQLGVGPEAGYMIEDKEDLWTEYISTIKTSDKPLNAVRTYVFLKVRYLFDPPATGYLVTAYERQIQEAEWRLNSLVDFQTTEIV